MLGVSLDDISGPDRNSRIHGHNPSTKRADDRRQNGRRLPSRGREVHGRSDRDAAFNPAVTLGAAVMDMFAWPTLWVYLVAQVLAGIAAGVTILVMNPDDK